MSYLSVARTYPMLFHVEPQTSELCVRSQCINSYTKTIASWLVLSTGPDFGWDPSDYNIIVRMPPCILGLHTLRHFQTERHLECQSHSGDFSVQLCLYD